MLTIVIGLEPLLDVVVSTQSLTSSLGEVSQVNINEVAKLWQRAVYTGCLSDLVAEEGDCAQNDSFDGDCIFTHSVA